MEENTRSLREKVAIVTGAGRGIGQAIARAYAREGAAICCAARTQDEIDSTARQIEAAGGRALAIRTDVTRPETVEHMVATVVEHFGGLDILVLNAGINTARGHIADSDPEAWRQTLEVNLVGAYHCARAAIPLLKERGGGKIIAIGSGMGHRSQAGSSAYACSKAGLWMLTRTLAEELWEHNISVNELIPGPVETDMSKKSRGPDSVFSIGSEWIKTPAEVVPLALFLATQPQVGPTSQSFSLMRRQP